MDTSSQLGVTCKLTEGALSALIQLIEKGVKRDRPQHRPLGNTTRDRSPAGLNSIHHHPPGPALQPLPYPAESVPVQATDCRLLHENTVGDSVKGFAEVWVDYINSPSLTHQTGHSIVEGLVRLVKQDLPFVNPCWLGLIPRLSRTCRVISLKTICSIIFPGTQVRLTGLQFPGSSLQPFW
ncbi:uncharacterized protein LOC124417648 [Gallus gallus]|uniref:uncharacterized protein LOC124417648 n=1 Tax=Gallus gallus TaxID=9031 RepID=UPI001F0327A4|nr:uncharacterized protein LOC124417648 [Gallus gallus]